jgi:hypothetical protein
VDRVGFEPTTTYVSSAWWYYCDMQGRYSTGLNYRPTNLCRNYDNLSVLRGVCDLSNSFFIKIWDRMLVLLNLQLFGIIITLCIVNIYCLANSSVTCLSHTNYHRECVFCLIAQNYSSLLYIYIDRYIITIIFFTD